MLGTPARCSDVYVCVRSARPGEVCPTRRRLACFQVISDNFVQFRASCPKSRYFAFDPPLSYIVLRFVLFVQLKILLSLWILRFFSCDRKKNPRRIWRERSSGVIPPLLSSFRKFVSRIFYFLKVERRHRTFEECNARLLLDALRTECCNRILFISRQ